MKKNIFEISIINALAIATFAFNKYAVEYLIIINLLLTLYTVVKARISLISEIIIISNYPIFPLMWQYFYGIGASSLSSSFGKQLMLKEMLIGVLIFNVITIYFFTFSNFRNRENKLILNKYPMGKKIVYCSLL